MTKTMTNFYRVAHACPAGNSRRNQIATDNVQLTNKSFLTEFIGSNICCFNEPKFNFIIMIPAITGLT